MKNNHPEIKTLAIPVNGELIEFPLYSYTTKWLLTLLADIETWDYDFVLPVMEELCKRGGLDLTDYKDCDDCYNAILHEFDVRNGEEK